MAKKKQQGNGSDVDYPRKNKDGKIIGDHASYYHAKRRQEVSRLGQHEKLRFPHRLVPEEGHPRTTRRGYQADTLVQNLHEAQKPSST